MFSDFDNRGKALLGHSDAELSSLGGYDLVHYDDLAYVASAHQERKLFSFFIHNQIEKLDLKRQMLVLSEM